MALRHTGTSSEMTLTQTKQQKAQKKRKAVYTDMEMEIMLLISTPNLLWYFL